MAKKFLALLCIFTISLLNGFENEELTVQLSTENQLIPIYLAKFVDSNSGIDAKTMRSWEETLLFDLNHNGSSYTLKQSADNEKLANKLEFEALSHSQEWQPHYVIRVTVKPNKKLQATVLSVNGELSKTIDGITLTGASSEDRKRIHQLADAIYKTLFEQEGIATTRLLYSVKSRGQGDKWISEIWEADYDGQNSTPVIRDGNYNITPVYIPPEKGFLSRSFFYVSYQSAQPKIYVATIKEGKNTRLSLLRGNQLMPAIARQRDQIAFICDVTGNPDLFLQKFSTSTGVLEKPRQIFAAKKASQGSPSFSPDGSKIAFVSNKDGFPKIYTIDVPPPGLSLKDIKAQLITKHSRESTAPAWSPDGTKLAYCALTNGTRQIWMYDFITRQEKQLTTTAMNKENPSWAPNSLCLVYNSSDTGSCELYLINIYDPVPTKITSGAGDKRFPNWEPR